jgi:alpha-L-fucosidase
MDGPEIIAALQNGHPPPRGTVWRPSEADVSIRPGWFHHPAEDSRVKTAEQLREIWFDSVGRNSNLLLNVPPNRDGLVADADAGTLALFRTRLGDYWSGAIAWRARGESARVVEVDLGGTTRIGGIGTEEAIAEGQRIARYHVDVLAESGWTPAAAGTTVGHLKVDRFTPVIASRVRITVDESLGEPLIRRVRVALA